MKRDYTLRIALVFLIFCSLYVVIVFNLYSIQIRQREFYTDLGKKQYYLSLTTMPPRAEIYDRHGNKLALNQDQLSAFVLPKEIAQPRELKTFLKKHFSEAVDRLSRAEGHFLFIKRRLTPEQVTLINESGLKDIHILKEPNRYYPFLCLSPVIGITDIDNKGMFGIEGMYNNQLAGTPTTYILEKDARSGHFYFKRNVKVEGTQGTPISLTIDSDLQFLAYEELEQSVKQFAAKEGAVLILDPTTGDIIVMASYPSFDPHNTAHLSVEQTKNKIVTDAHEPGSVIKIFLALAALEEKVTTAEEPIDCEQSLVGTVNGVKFSTVHADGVLPFADVIALSNNIGTAKVAVRLGSKLYDHYTRVGFGAKTGLSWPAEQRGFVNPPHKWSRPSIVSLSFGYEITASLLQLGLAFSIIANNGYSIAPRLLTTDPIRKGNKKLYSDETLATIRAILERTVTQGTGTKADIKGYTVMGKTGTANLVVNGEYSKTKNIYTFSGIVEKGTYKRVIVTFIKESPKPGLYAATVAAPLFGHIAQKMLIHDQMI